MSLSKPALNPLAIERSAMELWNEWLGSWFDGNSHAVGGHAATVFPKAELLFNQALPPHPMEAGTLTTPLAIHVVWIAPGKPYRGFEHDPATGTRQEVITQRGQFLFLVRCGQSSTELGNADAQSLAVAGLLYGLLINSNATKPLAEKGFHGLKANSPVVLQGEGARDYAVRTITAVARLRYTVLSQV